MTVKYTPMMEQYLALKSNYQDAIVFYRLGDFYEMFFDDAIVASKELDLVLTGRNAGVEDKVAMCGVPFHSVTPYIQKLVSLGYKVALVEQLEDPSGAVGIVRRDVVQVITPGTIFDYLDDEKKTVTIASVVQHHFGYSLCCCELASGTITCLESSLQVSELSHALSQAGVKEVVVEPTFNNSVFDASIICSTIENNTIDSFYSYLLNGLQPTFQDALCLLVTYLESTQKQVIKHLQVPLVVQQETYLLMSPSTMASLELVQPLKPKGETLWSFMDECQSSMGSRMLRKWIEKPLYHQMEIEHRLNRVEAFNRNFLMSLHVKEGLSRIFDLERLTAKMAMNKATPQDVLRLYKTLEQCPLLYDALDSSIFPEYASAYRFDELRAVLCSALNDEVPPTLKEGGIFKDGYNEQLDEYRHITRNGKEWLLQLEASEKEKTGIKTLKIGYNRVFGYYIEVSKGACSLITDDFGYVRKQTLSNAERFITSELKEKEDAILHSVDRAIALETQLFTELVSTIATYLPQLQHTAVLLATLDVYAGLSALALKHGYTRPTFNDGDVMIKGGKHPLLAASQSFFVANDCVLTSKPIMILTGPNMGGKSTYMRQVALIALMAQMGSFVPCKQCSLPLFDKMYTRIGASDDLLSGQSTFMVEMMEANEALSGATSKSLILFDEIGRGTSTYDGLALAQAIIEYITTCIKAKTLFSTHYHELVALEENIDGVTNFHVDVHEEKEEITFLYAIKKGYASRSYGIHVAKLAELPTSVCSRASELLSQLESKKRVVQQSYQLVEMEKKDPKMEKVKESLMALDINQCTPLEALSILAKLKQEIV